MHRSTFAEVDLTHLRSNYQFLRTKLGANAFLCPMVKANAYGHGDIAVTTSLRSLGCEHVGVGFIEEAEHLRAGGDQGQILLFGMFDPAGKSAGEILRLGLTPVLSDLAQLESFAKLTKSGNSKSKVHVKFNTGMNRLGFEVRQAAQVRQILDQNSQLILEGVCTHLSRGEDAGIPDGDSEKQFVAFEQALAAFAGLDFFTHSLNSSGLATLSTRSARGQALGQAAVWPTGARPGLALYGVIPSSDEAIEWPLQPVLNLKSSIVKSHRIEKGERISYNGTWQAMRPSAIAVIPIGYADGVYRGLSNRTHLLFRGRRVPVVGNVCMDYLMIDVTDVVNLNQGDLPKFGEEVVLIGRQGNEVLQANDHARLLGTISYEFFTRLSERVPRVVVNQW